VPEFFEEGFLLLLGIFEFFGGFFGIGFYCVEQIAEVLYDFGDILVSHDYISLVVGVP
jgi:hypothetical protein